MKKHNSYKLDLNSRRKEIIRQIENSEQLNLDEIKYVLEHTSIKKDTNAKAGEAKQKSSLSDQTLRQSLILAPDAYFHVDKNGNFIFVNDSAAQLTEYSKKELNGMNIFDLFQKEVLDNNPLRYDLLKKGKLVISTRYLKTKSGSLKIIEMHSRQLPDGSYQSFVRDISKRINIEQALIESEERFRTLTNSTSTAIFVYQGLNFVFVNKAACNLTGYSEEEMLNKKFWDVVHPDYQELIRTRGLQRQKGEKISNNYEFKLINKEGKVIWVDFTAGKILWKGQPAAIGTAYDITERNNAVVKLQESEKNLRTLINAMPDIVCFKDGEGRWLEANDFDLKLFDLENVNYRGKTDAELAQYSSFYKNALFNCIKTDEQAWNKKGQFRSEEIIPVQDGESRVFDVIKVPSYDSNGNRKGLVVVGREISKRKAAEEALKEREEKYRMISDLTSDYLFETEILADGTSRSVWVAGSFYEITGYSFEEYVEIGGWRKTIHQDDLEMDSKAFGLLLQNKNSMVELRTFHKDGRIVWVRSSGSPIWDKKQNKLIGVIGAVKDITSEKHHSIIQQVQYNIANAVVSTKNIKDLMSEVRAELNTIIDTKNFYIAFYDEKSGMLTSDIENDEKDKIGSWRAEKSLTGFMLKKKKPLLSNKKEILKIIDKGLINAVGTIPETWLGVPMKIGKKIIGAMVVQSYDNPDAYDKSSIEVLEVIANQLSLFIERKKAEEDTIRLSKAIIQSPVSILITDTEGKIIYVNPKFTEVTQYKFEEVVGKTSAILNSGYHNQEFYNNLWNKILSGNDWSGEFRNKKKNGQLFWESAVISPIMDEDGKITHFVAAKEDITEKKAIIEELIASKEQAEISEKVKTEFLAQMSHEIRSPLNVILSSINLIKEELEENINENIEFGFESIGSASKRIIRTIDLILNMTELQTGSYSPSLHGFSISANMHLLMSEYRQSASIRELKLKLTMELEEDIIYSDEYAISQIISNLVDNAIKYTKKGTVELKAVKKLNKNLIVSVKDTGIGISEEFIPNLFSSFTQEEQGYTRSYDGNGLGLALVKRYCELIGAEISVKSKKGKGTTFKIIFPNLETESN